MKVSIITVTYNAGEVLQDTFNSIREQLFRDVEYIVVDGKSTDNTLDLIHSNLDIISSWVSESDQGLYDAMNKGMERAAGDYLLFLNAGDSLYDSSVLMNIFSSGAPFSDVYYGETMIIDKSGKELGLRRLQAPENLHWKKLINGMLVCHQSFLVKKSLAPSYNMDYQLAADYDWMIRCLMEAKTITNTHLIVSKFLEGGLNKQYLPRGLYERFQIMIRYYNFFKVLFVHTRNAWQLAIFYLKNKRF